LGRDARADAAGDSYVQALDLVRENGLMLARLTEFQVCPQIVEAALGQNGLALDFASEIQSDHGVALIAVRHVSRSIQNTLLVNEAVKQNGLALEFAPPGMQSVYDLVMVAVFNNGDAIRFATPSL